MIKSKINWIIKSPPRTPNSKCKTPHNPSSKPINTNNKSSNNKTPWLSTIDRKITFSNGSQTIQDKNGVIPISPVQPNNFIKIKPINLIGHQLLKTSNGNDPKKSSKIPNSWSSTKINMESLSILISNMVFLPKAGLLAPYQSYPLNSMLWRNSLLKNNTSKEGLFLFSSLKTANGFKSLSIHYCLTKNNITTEIASTALVTIPNSFGFLWLKKHT